MPIALMRFDHSIDIPFLEEDSDLSLVLSTEPLDSPVTPEPFGDVTLAGSGKFVGGIRRTHRHADVARHDLPPVATTVPDVRELDMEQPAVW